MSKQIDLNKTVYELCSHDQDLPNILADIGFKDITKPGMLSTVGRFMTISKGAIAKNIDIETIKQELIRYGYTIID